MFLVNRIKNGIKVASPFLIHVFMIVSVTIYTVFGAYCIRAIENASIQEINRQNGYADQSNLKRVRRSGDDFVLTGSELAAVSPGLRPCVQQAIRDLLLLGNCSPEELKTLSIGAIDDCYRYAEIDLNKTQKVVKVGQGADPRYRSQSKKEDKEDPGWSLHNSIVFTFTLITTIGYGHVAPATTAGRIFCLIYGLVGVPLALLTIADIGMFLNKLVRKLATLSTVSYDKFLKWRQMKKSKSNLSACSNGTVSGNMDLNEVKLPNGSVPASARTLIEKPDEEVNQFGVEEEQRRSSESIILAIIFALYLTVGSFIVSLYEPNMNFFTAFYFNFVSLTTIGLGDLFPENNQYLVLTFIYLTVGLAITTMIIEIAADFLKKVHYFGRKLEDVASNEVWFGGKKMKLKNLIKHLGDQLNIPIEELEKFDIGEFVEDSLKVASGELKSLKKPEKPIHKVSKNNGTNISSEDFLSYTSDENPLHTARSTKSFQQKSISAR